MKILTNSRVFLPLLALIMVAMMSGCSRVTTVSLSGTTMGTTWLVKIVDERPLDVQTFDSLTIEIERELARINQVMSTWITNSNLSALNRAPIDQPVQVPEELIQVLELSKLIHQLSDGAFDVTVGPLVNLWGFGPDAIPGTVPDEAQIEAARSQVGMHYLEISDGMLTRERDLYVDLSAIAKGYAVDRISQLLNERSRLNHLVEIGGELKASGVNERNEPWVIAIERPEGIKRSIFRTLPLNALGMATSGEYRNFREIKGERYSHTIDPRSGRPVAHDLASVTVLHESTAMADGLATAINVLGPDEGMTLAKEQNLSVLFIIDTHDGFEENRSPALDTYLKEIQ